MKLYCSNDGSLKRSHDDSVEHSEPTGYRLIHLKKSGFIDLSAI